VDHLKNTYILGVIFGFLYSLNLNNSIVIHSRVALDYILESLLEWIASRLNYVNGS